MEIIAVANQKGGCGKTTTAVNVAAALAEMGNRTLVVDMDPQGHASLSLGLDPDRLSTTVYDVLCAASSEISEVIHPQEEGLHVAPANVLLASAEQDLAGKPDREYRLRDSLAQVDHAYAFAVIDCPPALGFLTINSLVAADSVIVPVDPSLLSLQGLARLMDTVDLVERNAGKKLPCRPLATMFDGRTRFAKEIRRRLLDTFGDALFETTIHASVVAREAAGAGTPIGKAAPLSRLHLEHLALARELQRAARGRTRRSLDCAGERVRGEQVDFRIAAPSASRVQLAGEFNGWDPALGEMDFDEASGTWAKRLRLLPGSYQYRYVVDGTWVEDPGNDRCEYSPEGFRNSLLQVAGGSP